MSSNNSNISYRVQSELKIFSLLMPSRMIYTVRILEATSWIMHRPMLAFPQSWHILSPRPPVFVFRHVSTRMLCDFKLVSNHIRSFLPGPHTVKYQTNPRASALFFKRCFFHGRTSSLPFRSHKVVITKLHLVRPA